MNLVQALYLNNDVEPFNNEQCPPGPVLCHRRGRASWNSPPRATAPRWAPPSTPPSPSTTMRASTDAYPYDHGEGQGAAHPGGLSRRVLHDHHRPLQLHPPHERGGGHWWSSSSAGGHHGAPCNPVEWETWLSETYIGTGTLRAPWWALMPPTSAAGALLQPLGERPTGTT